jgi:hypothetical protein
MFRLGDQSRVLRCPRTSSIEIFLNLIAMLLQRAKHNTRYSEKQFESPMRCLDGAQGWN